MKPFTVLTATAAPLPMANVDTDMIIPKQFLTTIERTGLGKSLFFDLRYDDAGKEKPDFILNRAPYRRAEILVAGPNFGCGSSREHAPWALLDFGIRGVIAPGYADIFYNNAFKNGILPVILPPAQVDLLMKEAQAQKKITIDLDAQEVKTESGQSFPFTLDPFRRHCLLNGLDDIGLTLEKAEKIDSYETRLRQDRPWLIEKVS